MLSKYFSAFFCFPQTRERLCYCLIMENKDAVIKNGDGIKHYLANKYSMSLIGHHWNTEHTELVPINLVKSPQLILNRVPVDEIQFKWVSMPSDTGIISPVVITQWYKGDNTMMQ